MSPELSHSLLEDDTDVKEHEVSKLLPEPGHMVVREDSPHQIAAQPLLPCPPSGAASSFMRWTPAWGAIFLSEDALSMFPSPPHGSTAEVPPWALTSAWRATFCSDGSISMLPPPSESEAHR